ncbi:hypothetical protein Alches_13380 [Alicyclobacillus hesperidum subsp. aegles]|uniref:glycosyltransferase n=1 Tax=Alicyclobacillus hesperidum TaxID=89784 RepID=UPI00222D72A2|nr:glycosyltransferase [Alicyclobacillus hesperidum]GLG01299.1 hypothetical protein Alches_13380 [Alicyclobacillus hesperidum subsp. aegles]
MTRAKPTVLVVSYFAPPQLNAEAILVWKTLRELASHFRLRLVTSDERAGSDARLQLPDAVDVIRSRTWKPTAYKPRRALEKLMGLVVDENYLWAKATHLGANESQCDVIYSRSQPGASHILALGIKRRTGRPWVAQFSDPWANNPYHVHHTSRRKLFNQRMEQAVVEEADVLIFPTAEIQEMYERSYPALPLAQKSVILPHHFTPELYPNAVARAPELVDKLVFSYLGDFYGARSPEPFLAGLHKAVAAEPAMAARTVVQFFGNVEAKFADLVAQSPVPVHRGRVSYLESLNMMRQADVLLLIDAPSANGRNPFLASKLIDYLGAGRRILGITDEQGTAADILRQHGHFVVSPCDVDGVEKGIRRCFAEFQSGVANQIAIPEEFTTQHVVGRLAELMERLLHK